MGQFLLASQVDQREKYCRIAQQYDFGFEMNDFYIPEILENKEKQEQLAAQYREIGFPGYCTMHGAFLDVTIFSSDPQIRQISQLRMEQSMEIAKKMGVKGVVFHTNVNPFLTEDGYVKQAVDMTVAYFEELLQKYPETDIYLENMFDHTPDVLQAISKRLCHYEHYGVCFDYAHASISPTPISDWIMGLYPYIKHLHINDNDGIHDLHLPLGEGKIDWLQFRDYYKRYFTQCTVLIETLSPEGQETSIRYLQALGLLSK